MQEFYLSFMEQGNLRWEIFESNTPNCLESVSTQVVTNSTPFSLSDTSDFVTTSPTYGPSSPTYYASSIGYRALNSGYEDVMIRSTRFGATTPVDAVAVNNGVQDIVSSPFSPTGPTERAMTPVSRDRSLTPEHHPDRSLTPEYHPDTETYSPLSPTYIPVSPTYSPGSPTDVNGVRYVQDRDGRIHSLGFLNNLDSSCLISLSSKINNILNRMEQ